MDLTGIIPHDNLDIQGKAHMFANKRVLAKLRCSPVSAWSSPAPGGLKANVDVGWDVLSGNAGVGVVLRNSYGSVLLSA